MSRTVCGMARRYTRGYRAHRGRRRGSTVLKVIIVLLLILLVAGILFIVFLGRYVEYTDSGVRVNLPWLQEGEPEGPAATDPVVIITEDPVQSPTHGQAVRTLDEIGVVEVTAQQLADGSAAQAVAAAGGNALVVEMKGIDGRLAWVSQTGQAAALGVNAQDDSVAQAVSALAQEDGLHLVARISCFRDQALASAGVGGPLMTQGGNIWYDASGYRWVSPVSQQVRDYLAQLCVELAGMGFDEILLESVGFPDLGETHVLATSENRPEDLTGPVAQFLEELSGALADTDAALSVLASQETVLGTDELTGMTPELLSEYAHRVWTDLPEQGIAVLTSSLERAGMDQAEQRIVSLGGSREEGSWTTLTAG